MKEYRTKDKPMNIKVPETLSKKYFKGKDQKSIEDIMEKALAAWFAAEGGAHSFGGGVFEHTVRKKYCRDIENIGGKCKRTCDIDFYGGGSILCNTAADEMHYKRRFENGQKDFFINM